MLSHLTHILLDAARMGEKMDTAKEMNATNDSLYRGGSEESLSAVAPYIFSFKGADAFAGWWLEEGWGKAWGLLLRTSASMVELHRHFRKFLLVKTEEGQELYFRFYDPRVLRIFLPTCDAAQIVEFFGPIAYFLMEDEDPEFALRFWHENGVLKSQRIDKAELQLGVSERETMEPAPLPSNEEIKTPKQEDIVQDVRPKTKWNMFD